MYESNRFEKFDSSDNIQIRAKQQRNQLRTTLPEEYSQTGYRNNFGEVFKKMTSE